MSNVFDVILPEHRAVIEEELAQRHPILLTELLHQEEPTLEQRETLNKTLAIAVIKSLGPDYTPSEHGLAVERAVKAFLEVWPIER